MGYSYMVNILDEFLPYLFSACQWWISLRVMTKSQRQESKTYSIKLLSLAYLPSSCQNPKNVSVWDIFHPSLNLDVSLQQQNCVKSDRSFQWFPANHLVNKLASELPEGVEATEKEASVCLRAVSAQAAYAALVTAEIKIMMDSWKLNKLVLTICFHMQNCFWFYCANHSPVSPRKWYKLNG